MSYQAMKRHGGNLNVYYQVKEANQKRVLYDSNYTTFWKRQNYGDIKKLSGCQGFRGGGQGGMNRYSIRDF